MYSIILLVVSLGAVLSYPTYPQNNENIPRCAQPAASGLCLAYFPSFFYNPSTEKCESFIFGGCGGNANRFFTERECMEACGGFKIEKQDFELRTESEQTSAESSESDSSEEQQPDNPTSESDSIKESQSSAEVQPAQPTEQESDPCKLPSQPGLCYAFLPRFYFNGENCESFIYGGCGGNENNFFTVEDCQRRCMANASREASTSSENESTSSPDSASSSEVEKESTPSAEVVASSTSVSSAEESSEASS